MRTRAILSLASMLIGLTLITLALASWIVNYAVSLNATVVGLVGVLLLVAGFLILVTEMFEKWLSRGQTALVDGLQAG